MATQGQREVSNKVRTEEEEEIYLQRCRELYRFIGKPGEALTRANVRPIIATERARKILVPRHLLIRPPLIPHPILVIRPPEPK